LPPSVLEVMFPSQSSVSALAAFAPLGPGAFLRSPPSPLLCGHPTPLPLQHASSLPSVMPYLRGSFRGARSAGSRQVRPQVHPEGSPSVCPHPRLRLAPLPRGRTGVSQVTGPSSLTVPSATHPAVSSSARPIASEDAAFWGAHPLSVRNCNFGAEHKRPTHSLAYASTVPLRRTTARLVTSLPATLWLGGARTHRTTHLNFGLHPDLPPDRHCLVAPRARRAHIPIWPA
jgi:hypothetical protein